MCGNTGAGELFVLSGGISADRKRWMNFAVKINNASCVISKSFLKRKIHLSVLFYF